MEAEALEEPLLTALLQKLTPSYFSYGSQDHLPRGWGSHINHQWTKCLTGPTGAGLLYLDQRSELELLLSRGY